MAGRADSGRRHAAFPAADTEGVKLCPVLLLRPYVHVGRTSLTSLQKGTSRLRHRCTKDPVPKGRHGLAAAFL